jgi:hypothetical protein
MLLFFLSLFYLIFFLHPDFMSRLGVFGKIFRSGSLAILFFFLTHPLPLLAFLALSSIVCMHIEINGANKTIWKRERATKE